ncbi:tyrosine-type recombinase/integrase [Streptacidiphilus pinicola]|uniref:tyrosine-type recombinase/integrase n=1 Tax=Streptacidiphilus pinicola TaxID=2219663 RepID=UPI001403F095|nr:site-specific integrase [Streptacidiphilus pinicola]
MSLPTRLAATASPPARGRIYRACGCRDNRRRLYGPRCPVLAADPEHGSWAFAVDLPSPDGKRSTCRRTGHPTREAAEEALGLLLTGENTGVYADPHLRTGDYLEEWLAARRTTLQPTTWAGYHDSVQRFLLPAFAGIRLVNLRSRHIQEWQQSQLALRGRPTVYRAGSTLRAALQAAVRARRLPYNPALHAIIKRPTAAERTCWSPAQAAAFLRHNHTFHADQLADLFEVMLGTGMRRGEVLGLHWADVHLMDRNLGGPSCGTPWSWVVPGGVGCC